MKTIWNGAILAESGDTIVVEGNHYFPPESINDELFEKTDHHTKCPWKGTAHYHTITVDDKSNKNAAWFYPEPKEAAQKIAHCVAFWKGVEIKD